MQTISDQRYYEWSSYHANALGQYDPPITLHPVWQALGSSDEERREVYQALFDQALSEDVITQIRQCTQTGVPLGSEKFRDQVEQLLNVKVGYSKQGRPKKE